MTEQSLTRANFFDPFPKLLFYFGGLLALSFLLWVEMERIAASYPDWWTTDMGLVAIIGLLAMVLGVLLMAIRRLYVNGMRLLAEFQQ